MHCRNAVPNHAFFDLKKLIDQLKNLTNYFIVTQNDHGLSTRPAIQATSSERSMATLYSGFGNDGKGLSGIEGW